MNTQNENIEKIKNLFLNKVKGLEWHYFYDDFNHLNNLKQNDYSDLGSFDSILGKISKSSYGNYECNASQPNLHEVIKSVLAFINQEPDIIRQLMLRIFDVNEKYILNQSDSDEGILGKLNKTDRKKRNRLYFEKINDKFRSNPNNVVILAEGDSWFEFPRILFSDPVEDILDHLIKKDKYAVYSQAAGGDWLSNIMYMGEYIEELPIISPDVMLISGGGNDLVGDNRLAKMVINSRLEELNDIDNNPVLKKLIQKRASNPEKDFNLDKYKKGLKYIHEDFFLFLDLCFIQYYLLFMNLKKTNKYDKVLFLTQGYDYAIPSNEMRGRMISWQRILNKFMKTGHWLYQPLNMKGITDAAVQKAIVYTMIHEFNEMMIQLVRYDQFPNVFHIDCRGTANSKNDWFDELHLESEKFALVAEAYDECITANLKLKPNYSPLKVYNVKQNTFVK